MRKIVIAMLGVVSLGLLSFYQVDSRGGSFEKIGDALYQTRGTVKFAHADEVKMKAILQREYGIKSFNSEQVLDFKHDNDPRNTTAKWWVITNKKWGPSFFNEKVIAGESKDKLSAQSLGTVREVTAIVSKYTSNPGKSLTH